MATDPSSVGYGTQSAPWDWWGKGLVILTRFQDINPSPAEGCSFGNSAGLLPPCNTNKSSNRDIDEYTDTGLKSPIMDSGGVLHIHDVETPPSTPDWCHLAGTEDGPLYCETGALWAVAGFSDDWDTRFGYWSPTGQCTWINTSGTPISAAARIPHDEEGCRDCIPGIFGIEFVEDSIIAGVSADIRLVYGKSWYRSWSDYYGVLLGYDGYTAKDPRFCPFDLEHPYIDPDGEITVDLSTNNENRHVIPGVVITFNSNPSAGSKATIAVGWEYVPTRLDTDYEYDVVDDDYDFLGYKAGGPAFVPLAVWPQVQQGTERAFEREGGPAPEFVCMNLTGALQSGCKLRLTAFVSLDQGNAVSPFAAWFMGGGYIPTESAGDYTVTFQNYRAGSPAAIDLYCTGSVDTDIRSVDETDYSLDAYYYDGEGLAADGTLYFWPAMGVYFRISEDARTNDQATVRIYDDKLVFCEAAKHGPHTIGRWGKTVGALTADGYYATGDLQAQGYDVEFECSSLDATRTHWYNHFDGKNLATTSTLGSQLADDRKYVCAVQLYCDDPRYFCVVPITFYSHGSGSTPDQQWKARALVAESDSVSVAFVARTGSPDNSLLVQAHVLPTGMKAILDAIGVTKS